MSGCPKPLQWQSYRRRGGEIGCPFDQGAGLLDVVLSDAEHSCERGPALLAGG
jgi:hypothetical protein